MERTHIFDLMGELRLYGMKAAFDDIMATAVKRQHEPQRVVGDLLTAEISEKQARLLVRAGDEMRATPLAQLRIVSCPSNGSKVNSGGIPELPRGLYRRRS